MILNVKLHKSYFIVTKTLNKHEKVMSIQGHNRNILLKCKQDSMNQYLYLSFVGKTIKFLFLYNYSP